MIKLREDGYCVLRNVFDAVTIMQFKMWAMSPKYYHRGNATDGNYYGKHDGKREYDVWWTTQPPEEMWKPLVWSLGGQIGLFFDTEWDVHAVDCITTRPGSSKVYAHIDTPYRFEEFSQVDRTLGVQIIIPLDPFNLENGATAFLPGSHKEKYDFRDMETNREVYNSLLLREGMQFVARPGDVLMYDGRTLHSTMPNGSQEFRSALLINVLEKSIIDRVRQLDGNTDFVKT